MSKDALCAVQTFSGLQPGTYRASIYTSSQTQQHAGMAVFTVNTEGPAATITRAADGVLQYNAATFYFQSEASNSFQCRLLAKASADVPTFAACTSPA